MSKGENTRRFIIERSASIFNIKGVAATAMSDIMDATKLSKGSLYVHFENKDLLSGSVVEYNLDLLMEKVNAAVSKYKTARGKLLAYLELFTDPLRPPVKGGCPMINFGMEADDTNPVIRQKVSRVVELAQQNIAAIIKDGIRAGEFNPDWNYDEFATTMFAMIEGGVIISRIMGNNKKMKVIAGVLRRMIDEQSI